MSKITITVLKKIFDRDLADEYCQSATPCHVFGEGQEFIVENEKPKGFCDWAWNDIYKVYLTLRWKGDFTPWMKDENNVIACCTDGIHPVVFRLERIETEQASTGASRF